MLRKKVFRSGQSGLYPAEEAMKRKCRLSDITVEPVALAFMLGQYLSFPTNSSLIYKKSCLENFNTSFCDDMDNKTFQDDHKDEQDVVQETASKWTMYTFVALSVPSIFVVFFFIGSWGDKVDRKVSILLPCMGAILNNVSYLLNSIYMEWPIEYLVIGQGLNGLLGNFSTALMGFYTYVAHSSMSSEKTVRIGVLESLAFLSGSIASFVSGLLLKEVGFSGVYTIALSCQGFAVLYCILFVRGIKPPAQAKEEKAKCLDFWILDCIRDMAAFIRKKQPGRNRFYIWMYILLINMVLLGTLGELDILYLFLRRSPRSFNPTEYGYFRGSENFCRSFPLITLLPFMKNVLQIQDTSLIMLGVLFKGLGFIFLGIATTHVAVFSVLILTVLHGFPAAAIRSGLSDMVDKQENGRVFALVAATESLLQMVATFIFNNLYPLTLHFFDGLLYECAAGFCFVILIIAVYVHLDMSKHGIVKAGALDDQNGHLPVGMSVKNDTGKATDENVDHEVVTVHL